MNENKPEVLSSYDRLIQSLQQQINSLYENMSNLEITLSCSLVPHDGTCEESPARDKCLSDVESELVSAIDQIDILNSRIINLRKRSIFYKN